LLGLLLNLQVFRSGDLPLPLVDEPTEGAR
jgi:hypothetical protein